MFCSPPPPQVFLQILVLPKTRWARSNQRLPLWKLTNLHNILSKYLSIFLLLLEAEHNNLIIYMKTLFVFSVHASSQDGTEVQAWQSPYVPHPTSEQFLQCCFWNSSNVGLINLMMALSCPFKHTRTHSLTHTHTLSLSLSHTHKHTQHTRTHAKTRDIPPSPPRKSMVTHKTPINTYMSFYAYAFSPCK